MSSQDGSASCEGVRWSSWSRPPARNFGANMRQSTPDRPTRSGLRARLAEAKAADSLNALSFRTLAAELNGRMSSRSAGGSSDASGGAPEPAALTTALPLAWDRSGSRTRFGLRGIRGGDTHWKAQHQCPLPRCRARAGHEGKPLNGVPFSFVGEWLDKAREFGNICV